MELNTIRLPDGLGALRRNEPLAPLSSWRIGGPADVLVEPHSPRAVAYVVRFASEHGIPLVTIGAASNLLFDDAGVRGIVLRIAASMAGFRFDGCSIEAQAGVMMPRLAFEAARAGLSGLEDLAGVPGTLGGTVAMNGGIPEHPLGDRIVAVRVVDHAGAERLFGAADCRFAYRSSRFKDGREIVVGATLATVKDDPASIRARMEELLEERRLKFPLDLPSAGSVFLRSPDIPSPGRAIEEAGLKGLRVGDAAVSGKHANFIVNLGHARSADVLDLMRQIRLAVHSRTGYWLRSEVRHVLPDGSVREAAADGDGAT